MKEANDADRRIVGFQRDEAGDWIAVISVRDLDGLTRPGTAADMATTNGIRAT